MNDSKKYFLELINLPMEFPIDKHSEINFFNSHTPFEGTPKRHPFDAGMVLLFMDPFSESAPFIEFPASSIGKIEELNTLASENGNTGVRIRMWIKRGTRGIISRTLIT
jgi:inorganic pyrophosphatase